MDLINHLNVSIWIFQNMKLNYSERFFHKTSQCHTSQTIFPLLDQRSCKRKRQKKVPWLNWPIKLCFYQNFKYDVSQIFSKHFTAPPSDFELMSSMMQKIIQLERKVKTQAVDIELKVRHFLYSSCLTVLNLFCCTA